MSICGVHDWAFELPGNGQIYSREVATSMDDGSAPIQPAFKKPFTQPTYPRRHRAWDTEMETQWNVCPRRYRVREAEKEAARMNDDIPSEVLCWDSREGRTTNECQ
jgi:hypothetical protein